MRVHKSVTAVAGIAILSLGLAACSGSSSGGGGGSTASGSSTGGGSSTPKGQAIYGEGSDFPENLMPIISSGNVTSVGNIESRLLDGPFRITPKIAYETDPDQADGEPTSELVNGQQVVTIKINPKAVWDDGVPITAADYVFTWQEQKSSDPKTGGCAALLSTVGFDQIESGVAVDDHTVKFTFIKGKSFGDWKSLFAGENALIISKHVFDKGSPAANCAYITKGWPIAGGIPAGATNGPWLLKTENINVASKTITLVPNPKYWGAPPKLARLVYANIGSDSDTNVKALQNSEVNIVYPQPQLDLVANLKKLSSVTTEINFGVSFEHFDFNTRDPLLAKPEVRKAIALATDREALTAATVGKFDSRATDLGNRMLLSNQTGYEDHSGAYGKQDIAGAKAALESAGATLGSDGYYSIGGKELAFSVITTVNNPLRNTTIQLFAQQLKAAGIKITESVDPDIFAGADKARSLEAGGFQIALFAWVGGPALSSNISIYHSVSGAAQGQNYTHGGTPAIDAALATMGTSTDDAAKIAAANAADKLLWDQMYTLPLYQKPTLIAYSSNLQNVHDNSTQVGPLWNSDTFQLQ